MIPATWWDKHGTYECWDNACQNSCHLTTRNVLVWKPQMLVMHWGNACHQASTSLQLYRFLQLSYTDLTQWNKQTIFFKEPRRNQIWCSDELAMSSPRNLKIQMKYFDIPWTQHVINSFMSDSLQKSRPLHHTGKRQDEVHSTARYMDWKILEIHIRDSAILPNSSD